jgi:hypothetical protein
LQIVQETLSQKNPSQKRAGRVAQGVSPQFKHQYHQKKKNLAIWKEDKDSVFSFTKYGVAFKLVKFHFPPKFLFCFVFIKILLFWFY